MTTIVNTPPTTTREDTSSSMSGILMFVIGIAALLFIVYMLLPVLRRVGTTPAVSVPDKIDVNVNTPNSQ